MKADLINIEGKKLKQIELPECFSETIREDLIKKAFLSAQSTKRQPYGAYPLAGKMVSASGKISHARRKWKSLCKRAISKIPRKILSRKGGDFFWQGAFIPGTKGGRRAHPPKAEKNWEKKINKKEREKALRAAIAGTADMRSLLKRYLTLKNAVKDVKEKINLPIIVESNIEDIKKTNELKKVLIEILGPLKSIAFRKRKIRAGKGKKRGRYYKKGKGLLIISKKKIPGASGLKGLGIDNLTIKNISIIQVAPAGVVGRLTLYTEEAISEMKNIGGLK